MVEPECFFATDQVAKVKVEVNFSRKPLNCFEIYELAGPEVQNTENVVERGGGGGSTRAVRV